MRGGFLRRLPEGVSWLQVRADLIGEIPPGRLREEFGGRLLYALGSRGGAGVGESGGFDRRRRLIAAAEDGYDLIDLDDERDIDEDVLAAIPPEKRLISWRGPASSESELASRFRRLTRIAARAYALIVEPRRAVRRARPLVVPAVDGAQRRDRVRRRRDGPVEPRPRATPGSAPGFLREFGPGGRAFGSTDLGTADRGLRPTVIAGRRSDMRDRGDLGGTVVVSAVAQRDV